MEQIIHPVHPRAAVGRTSVDPQAGTLALGPCPPRLRHGPTRPPALQNDRVTLRPTTRPPRLPRSAPPPRVLLAGLRCDSLPHRVHPHARGWGSIWEFGSENTGPGRGWREERPCGDTTSHRHLPWPPSPGQEAVRGSPSRPCRCTLLHSLPSFRRFGFLEVCKVAPPRPTLMGGGHIRGPHCPQPSIPITEVRGKGTG